MRNQSKFNTNFETVSLSHTNCQVSRPKLVVIDSSNFYKISKHICNKFRYRQKNSKPECFYR